ncbi:hypothetical protein SMACR_00822 [Sordaria macrospora]|uniref:Uncharacterized protein n=1 Tax=Sordaria macrospora TaxID=5147 RepID=A0A8S8ZZT1_SORMA|nr:hypothetical protein SMACR_00822 [Sordaria macrospora]
MEGQWGGSRGRGASIQDPESSEPPSEGLKLFSAGDSECRHWAGVHEPEDDRSGTAVRQRPQRYRRRPHLGPSLPPAALSPVIVHQIPSSHPPSAHTHSGIVGEPGSDGEHIACTLLIDDNTNHQLEPTSQISNSHSHGIRREQNGPGSCQADGQCRVSRHTPQPRPPRHASLHSLQLAEAPYPGRHSQGRARRGVQNVHSEDAPALQRRE